MCTRIIEVLYVSKNLTVATCVTDCNWGLYVVFYFWTKYDINCLVIYKKVEIMCIYNFCTTTFIENNNEQGPVNVGTTLFM